MNLSHSRSRTVSRSLFSRRHLSFALVLAALATACADEDASDASRGASPTEPAPAEGGACNALVQPAEAVPVVAEPSEAPPATGGALANGTYVLRASTLYTRAGGAAGPTGAEGRMVIAVNGSVIDTVRDGERRRGTFTIDGNTLEIKTTCPAGGSDETEYSATPNEIRVYVRRSNGTLVQTFANR